MLRWNALRRQYLASRDPPARSRYVVCVCVCACVYVHVCVCVYVICTCVCVCVCVCVTCVRVIPEHTFENTQALAARLLEADQESPLSEDNEIASVRDLLHRLE